MGEKQSQAQSSDEVNQMTAQKDDGTVQSLKKQLVEKDREITKIQISAKKKQLELENLLKKEKKIYIEQSSKLNSKLTRQESLVAKYSGVEKELQNLRSSVQQKG